MRSNVVTEEFFLESRDGKTTLLRSQANIVRLVDRVDNTEQERWRVPYYAIIIPVTLLSAYLILWKPRPEPKGAPDA
jgi:hypothetical protein